MPADPRTERPASLPLIGPFSGRDIARFVLVATVAYLALLVPWRALMPGYAVLLAPPARAIVNAVDEHTVVTADGPYVRMSRLYDELRVSAQDDRQSNPVLFHWLNHALGGDLHRAMYPLDTTRPKADVKLVDLFRLTLDIPLFLALLLALPLVPWRRRILPALIGLSVLAVIHVLANACMGIWMAQRDGGFVLRAGILVDESSPFWRSLADRYQSVGPAVALALFLALLLLGAFGPLGRRPQ